MERRKQRFGNWFKNSITLKMLMVGCILLVLLIPLGFVKSLIFERGLRQHEVIGEINGKWGNEVVLNGPIIKIPYVTRKEERTYDSKTKSYRTTYRVMDHTAFFLPTSLDIEAQVDTETLERGIYESVVYTGNIHMNGHFNGFDFSLQDIPEQDIKWDKAVILFKTSNVKGIQNELAIQLNGKPYVLKPQYNNEYTNTLGSGFIKDFATLAKESMDFTLDLAINGSESLQFIPVGKETKARMTSDWHSPSFNGNYLPNDKSKQITDSGFQADWKILEINRNFGQQFFDQLPELTPYAFGSRFIVPIDDYQKTERTSKYGLLIIGLTLLAFLLIQIMGKINIHPFQYLMIGLALVMFYILLLSISEHQNYLTAYIIAGSAVIGLITIYSKTILQGLKFPMLIFSSLVALYGFIYVIIQLEDYALLVGSIGLFIILALIMFATKKIEWHPPVDEQPA